MNALKLKKDLTNDQLLLVSTEMNKFQKSKGIAYLLWFFFGCIGGHRFYSRNYVRAIFMILTLGGLGFWAFFDVFVIGSRIEDLNDDIEEEIINQVKRISKNS